jgi:hypothetical protein
MSLFGGRRVAAGLGPLTRLQVSVAFGMLNEHGSSACDEGVQEGHGGVGGGQDDGADVRKRF